LRARGFILVRAGAVRRLGKPGSQRQLAALIQTRTVDAADEAVFTASGVGPGSQQDNRGSRHCTNRCDRRMCVTMKKKRLPQDRFLDNWAALVEPVVPYFSYRPSIRGPNDEMFVETAINGRARALITFNVKDYHISDDRMTSHGIRISRPGEFLRGLKWRPSATTLSAFRLR